MGSLSLMSSVILSCNAVYDVLFVTVSYLVQLSSVLTTVHFTLAGLMQIVTYVGAGSFSQIVSQFLGIDTVAILKLRCFTATVCVVQMTVTIALQVRPPFYYHLVRSYPMPKTSWVTSLFSTSLLFFSFNVTILAEIIKKLIDGKLIQASANKSEDRSSSRPLLSTIFLVLLEICNIVAFAHYLILAEAPKAQSNLSILFTFMFYLSCEGFLAPTMVIFSVDNLRHYLFNKLSESATILRDSATYNYFLRKRKVDPMIQLFWSDLSSCLLWWKLVKIHFKCELYLQLCK